MENNWLSSFFPCLLLMGCFDEVLHNKQKFFPPYSYVQRLNLTAELILSSWSKVIVTAHANFTFYYYYYIIVIIHFCFLAVCLQSPPCSLFNEFAQAYYILQVKMEKQSEFLYFNSSGTYTVDMIRYLHMKYFDWTAIYIRLYVNDAFTVLKV